jgi:hypothetical protein
MLYQQTLLPAGLTCHTKGIQFFSLIECCCPYTDLASAMASGSGGRPHNCCQPSTSLMLMLLLLLLLLLPLLLLPLLLLPRSGGKPAGSGAAAAGSTNAAATC